MQYSCSRLTTHALIHLLQLKSVRVMEGGVQSIPAVTRQGWTTHLSVLGPHPDSLTTVHDTSAAIIHGKYTVHTTQL